MKRLLITAVVAGLIGSTVAAENHFQGMAQDALDDAQVFTDYTRDTADDVLGIPVETDLPQSDMLPGDLEDAGLITSTTDTTEGHAFGAISDNITDWGVAAFDQSLLGAADAAVSDPGALVDPATFSTSGGACTVDNFEEAPLLQRVCNRAREGVLATCTSTANITVIRTETHECTTLVDPITGTDLGCNPELETVSSCTVVEERCENSFEGVCLENVSVYSCSSDSEIPITGNQVGSTSFSEPIVTWSESCEPAFSAPSCTEPVTACTSGATVEDMNGVLVPMDCTVEETVWSCAAQSYSSDCGVFETDTGCSLQSSVCYTVDADGFCGGYEDTYRCGGAPTQAFDATCEAVNVCVGGTCQSVPQESNEDLAPALIGVEMLNNMASELDHDATIIDALLGNVDGDFDVQYFTATRRRCRIGSFGTINCCADSGWALGSIAECNSSEVALYGAKEAGAAVYLSTYCSNRALFFCVQRSRRYCTYNSRIARIISEQGLRQLYGSFECRAMTQEEMEAIDFSLIDFSAAFGDMFEGVGSIAPNDLSGLIQDNILLSQPEIQDVYE